MKVKIEAKERVMLSAILSQCAPISISNVKKLIKAKEARVNGKRVSSDVLLDIGDCVEAFIPSSFLGEMPQIIYEDGNVLIVDKPILTEIEPTLTEIMRGDREFIKPLHRLDRNTTGLVAFALNQTAYDALFAVFKARTVKKYYHAVVVGKPKVGEYTDYLFKDEKKSHCYVSHTLKVGYKKIVTKICESVSEGELSVVNIQLITGRTHQIRAHLSFLGWPILGDGKYGDDEMNKKYKCKYQKLCAYKLVFLGLEGEMSYLNEKVFTSTRKVID
ncbi:MAG: RluA family pseudouridine synthase [Clostridiales bacterium]|nr:RluA family pseudouridine synthase [Clostridiales bacterium]